MKYIILSGEGSIGHIRYYVGTVEEAKRILASEIMPGRWASLWRRTDRTGASGQPVYQRVDNPGDMREFPISRVTI